jgi:DNA polymerase III subunit delta
LPDGVTLLISAVGCDQRRVLFQTIKKLGDVALFDAPEAGKRDGEEQIGEFIREKLGAVGKRFDAEALGAFRALVEPSLREIANELEKLCLYVGPRPEIRAADVQAICSASRQAIIWELVDAVGARALPKAIAAVEQLLAQGEAALGVVMMLAAQFRLMLLAKDLAQRKVLVPGERGFEYVQRFDRLGKEQPDLVAHFPRTKEGGLPNGWRLHRCAVAARHFSNADLIRAMDLLLAAHLQLVTTQLDERLVLEEALTKIARRNAG